MRSSLLLAALAALVLLAAAPAPAHAADTARVAVLTLTCWLKPGNIATNITVALEGIYGTFGPEQELSNVRLVRSDPINGCAPVAPPLGAMPRSWVPLAIRSQDGNCSFYDKTVNAYASGAAGIIIMNFEADKIVVMGGRDSVEIPTIAVSGNVGNQINALLNDPNVTSISLTVTLGDELALTFNSIFSKLFFDIAIFFMVFCAVTVFVLGGYYLQRRRMLREAEEYQKYIEMKTRRFVDSLPTKPYVRPADKPEGEEDDACAVCLDAFEPEVILRTVPCGHFFHRDCIDPWLITHRTCPLCKADIMPQHSSDDAESQDGVDGATHGPASQQLPAQAVAVVDMSSYDPVSQQQRVQALRRALSVDCERGGVPAATSASSSSAASSSSTATTAAAAVGLAPGGAAAAAAAAAAASASTSRSPSARGQRLPRGTSLELAAVEMRPLDRAVSDDSVESSSIDSESEQARLMASSSTDSRSALLGRAGRRNSSSA